jgi:hypothetical protein
METVLFLILARLQQAQQEFPERDLAAVGVLLALCL